MSAKPKRRRGRSAPSGEPAAGSSPSPGLGPALTGAGRIYVTAAAFVSGACLMIMELVASRVMAPVFGNTVLLWTSVIGLILAALSLGYGLGGWMADRSPRLSTLCQALAGAGVLVAVVPLLSPTVLDGVAGTENVIGGLVWSTAVLFLPPAVLMGTIPPMAVKLVARDPEGVGRAAGTVSAMSTLGSILGTFGAGFVLIPMAGNQAILAGIAGAMLLVAALGLLLQRGGLTGGRVLLLLLGAGLAVTAPAGSTVDAGVLHEKQNFYHLVRVREQEWGGRPTRILTLDTTVEGAMYLDGPGLPVAYTEYVDAVDAFVADPRRAAFVGGGAYTMPKRFLDGHPGAVADVFEIDPEVVEVSERFFETGSYPRLRHRVGDARHQLDETREPYDLIFGDAYNGIRQIPFHLATREFYRTVRDRLAPGGVYMANIISALEGPDAGFFQSTVRTLEEVFPEVYAFARLQDRRRMQNVILVCPATARGLDMAGMARLGRKHQLEMLLWYLVPRAEYRQHVEVAPVLTDDWAPVEFLVGGG